MITLPVRTNPKQGWGADYNSKPPEESDQDPHSFPPHSLAEWFTDDMIAIQSNGSNRKNRNSSKPF